MARKNPRIYTYTVTGKGSFPLDMLRYDVASPADAKSAALIKASSRRARAFFGYPEIYRYSVRLVSAYEPTLGRWESFGWEVSDVSSARTAKNNPRSTGYVAAKIRANTARKNSHPYGKLSEDALFEIIIGERDGDARMAKTVLKGRGWKGKEIDKSIQRDADRDYYGSDSWYYAVGRHL